MDLWAIMNFALDVAVVKQSGTVAQSGFNLTVDAPMEKGRPQWRPNCYRICEHVYSEKSGTSLSLEKPHLTP
jgi:hypothetical protein